jgi:hypothetical protein
MAADSSPRKKFDLANPGGREYAIVGAVVLAGALVWFYLRKRAAADTTGADTTGTGDTSAPGTPTGLSTAQLLAWIQDHSSSTTTTKTGGETGGGGGTTTGKTPDYWQTAIDLLRKQGNTRPTHAQIEAEYRKITPLAVRKKEEAANKARGKV